VSCKINSQRKSRKVAAKGWRVGPLVTGYKLAITKGMSSAYLMNSVGTVVDSVLR
jgi:hypothetical protein